LNQRKGFVQAIHLKHLEKLAPIFEVAGISTSDFTSDLKLLHRAEIVDLCNDEAARISDQSFSNFLIKYVFIEEKIIPLSTMIETGSILHLRPISLKTIRRDMRNGYSDIRKEFANWWRDIHLRI